MFNDQKSKQAPQTLASSLDDDFEIIESSDNEKQSYFTLFKLVLTGQYTYITYMILSTTCFFFWLSPNFHKVKAFFGSPGKDQKRLH